MYAVCVTLQVRPGQMQAFLPVMREQARRSLEREPGCHRFDVCGPMGGEVFLYELYSDQAAFERHLETAHFKHFDATVRTMLDSKQLRTFDLVSVGGA